MVLVGSLVSMVKKEKRKKGEKKLSVLLNSS